MQISHLLTNKVALITGASRGIGRATAIIFAQAGAKLVVTARSSEALAHLVEEITAQGGQAIAHPTDISNPVEVAELYQTACHQFGQVDILVNNAALLQPMDMVWQTDPLAWQTLMAVNVNGPYFCSQVVLPAMLHRKQGWIVNVSSGAASANVAGLSAYCASKAALERFSTVLAAEVAGHGLIVTTLRPGVVESHMQHTIRNTPMEQLPQVNKWQTLYEDGNLRPPQEPALAILWLASRFAHQANGQHFNLDQPDFRQRLHADLGIPLFPGRTRP